MLSLVDPATRWEKTYARLFYVSLKHKGKYILRGLYIKEKRKLWDDCVDEAYCVAIIIIIIIIIITLLYIITKFYYS